MFVGEAFISSKLAFQSHRASKRYSSFCRESGRKLEEYPPAASSINRFRGPPSGSTHLVRWVCFQAGVVPRRCEKASPQETNHLHKCIAASCRQATHPALLTLFRQ